jgi:hypothetical protein
LLIALEEPRASSTRFMTEFHCEFHKLDNGKRAAVLNAC